MTSLSDVIYRITVQMSLHDYYITQFTVANNASLSSDSSTSARNLLILFCIKLLGLSYSTWSENVNKYLYCRSL